MRKTFLMLIVIVGLLGVSALGAQESIYARTIFIDRVYENQYGYALVYGDTEPYYNEVMLPLKWFGPNHGAFAKVHRVRDPAAPYILLYYTNGVISDINLYIPTNPFHPRRYVLQNTSNIRERFDIEIEDVEF